MKQFLQSIKDSVFNPQWYSNFIPSNQGGFGYFFKVIATLSLLFTVALGAKILPKVGPVLNGAASQFTQAFPADLKVDFKDGEISTNAKEPYYIAMPEDATDSRATREHQPKYLAVIDTAAEPSIEALEQHDAAVLITKSAVVYYDSNKYQTRIQDLSAFTGVEFQISRETIGKFTEEIVPVLKRLSPVLLIGVYFGAFAANAALLLYALLGTLLVLFVARMKKNQASYGRLYNTTLHLMTLPLLVTWLFRIIGMWFQIPTIPFLFSVLLILAAALNLTALAAPALAAPQTPAAPAPTSTK